MSKASEVVAIALGEVGYKEKATNANLDSKTGNAGSNNWTKYARDLRNAGYYNGNKNGYAWCDVFVDWCFFKAYGAVEGQKLQCQTGDLGAGCTYSMQYFKKQGRLDMKPKVGDQIFFRHSGNSEADHTGIIVEVTSSQVITVEGNSDNQVKKNTYARNNSTICGYGHPKYTETTPAAPGSAAEPIKVGSKVEIKTSAERYNPASAVIPEWVKADYYHIVTQLTSNGKSVVKGGKTCVLLGKKVSKKGGSEGSGVNTWTAIDNLTVVDTKTETYRVHTVVKGDTLWAISQKYLGSGARYTEIMKLNGLTSTVIIDGQKLNIPN